MGSGFAKAMISVDKYKLGNSCKFWLDDVVFWFFFQPPELNFEQPLAAYQASKPSSCLHQPTFGDRAFRPGTGSPRISRTRIRGCQDKGTPT